MRPSNLLLSMLMYLIVALYFKSLRGNTVAKLRVLGLSADRNSIV